MVEIDDSGDDCLGYASNVNLSEHFLLTTFDGDPINSVIESVYYNEGINTLTFTFTITQNEPPYLPPYSVLSVLGSLEDEDGYSFTPARIANVNQYGDWWEYNYGPDFDFDSSDGLNNLVVTVDGRLDFTYGTDLKNYFLLRKQDETATGEIISATYYEGTDGAYDYIVFEIDPGQIDEGGSLDVLPSLVDIFGNGPTEPQSILWVYDGNWTEGW